ncbi:Cu(I)-responsive transcriptional regulator [Ahrensia sp. R2A130]|uniref:Cu(I)-responsive transcriptional regulator n=1 Tax=Ahrensia sp. R2A130 TaxID=744979 RepID=UPI0001E0E847|nr:Cu(I)-responsive transcriptional regulator [Ahrensia sp. R2A130]EFL90931.1 HTH-type transcriptional regulator CueR [Ahrensia sp. R2A130]
MNIKDAAQACGLPPKTVRYYEEIGLVTAGRAANGYRAYDERDVHSLRFVQRARSLGFTIEECRQLLSLYRDDSRASADVKALALGKIAEVETKIAELVSMKTTLSALAKSCNGDQRQDCPIIDDLAKDPE